MGYIGALAVIWRILSYYLYLFIGTIVLPRWLRNTAEVEEGPPFELWIVSARRALERVFYFGELWVAIGGSVGQVGQLLRLDLRPLP